MTDPLRRPSTARSSTALCVFSVAVLLLGSPAFAQTAENVAVVINENSAESVQIGEYYIKKRGIPATNVIRLRTGTEDNIDRLRYATSIENPTAGVLSRESLQDRVLYIVLTKGVPLRIVGTVGPTATVSSVDSELALLYRKMTGRGVAPEGRVDNPYFLGTKSVAEALPFTHREYDIFLVTRLDGFTVADAMAVVDRSLAASSKVGRIVLDQQDKLVDRTGENWLKEAADRLAAQQAAERVVLETTVKPARDVKPVLGYYSWGSNDRNNQVRRFGMGFVPGALAAMYVSSDARTFKEPPAAWMPTNDEDRTKWFAGTPQSLIGDLIREGVTGVAGHVAEPYLESTVRPQILFPAYLRGRNLAESFYLAIPHLSWQTIVIGDPLAAPFKAGTLPRERLEEPVDATTLMPGLFSARRMAMVRQAFGGAPDRAVALAVRAEALANRGDAKGARSAFEESAELAPNVVPLQLQLAVMYEQAGQSDAAEARYRKVIALDEKQPVALNNLANLLTTRRTSLAEAVALARRAVALLPQNVLMLDTLAFAEHLTGDNAQATAHIEAALKGAAQLAPVRLHAAMIFAATGKRERAEQELQEALKLAPVLESNEEVKKLRDQIARLPQGTP